MRILLTGKNGQVGWELERALAPQHTTDDIGGDTPGGKPRRGR